jgi:hypothetical protein
MEEYPCRRHLLALSFFTLPQTYPPPEVRLPAAWCSSGCGNLVSIDHIFGACEEHIPRSNDFAAPLSPPTCPCSEDAN